MKRAWKTIYCDPDFEHEVEMELALLMNKFQEEHPEYRFDMDLNWDAVKEEEEDR